MNIELIQETHIGQLVAIANDSRVASTSGVPEDCNADSVRQWIDSSLSSASKEMHYVLSEHGKVIGCCILKKIDWSARDAELSYWLGVDYWGKGFGTKAASMMADVAFRILGMQRLNAHYLAIANAPSGKILKKLGFVPDRSRPDLKADGRFLMHQGDVWTFVHLTRTMYYLM